MSRNNLATGAQYLITGAKLITHERFRLFVIVPVLVNVAIFLVLTTFVITYFSPATNAIINLLPDWQWLAPVLEALAVLIWVAAAIVAVILYGYSFSIITNILAAPFYGILAEKVEVYYTGKGPPPEAIAPMIARVTQRELVKLWYFVSRGIGLFILAIILGFIPFANFFVPIILALWAAWCMAIQFADYPADNHRVPFSLFRQGLGQTRYSAWGFGGLTSLGTMIPVLNIVVMPAAVAGGTVYWLKELSDQPEISEHKQRLAR